MTVDRKYPYFEKGLVLPRWKLKPEPAHCIAVDGEKFRLSTDHPPPKLRDQPPAPPTPKKPPEPKRPPKSLIEGFLEFKEWLNTPSPPKPAPALASAPPPPKSRVKPFDLLDIPGAMDRIDWPMSAKVMRKWFAGELNYCTTDADAARGINQHGQPFPPSMIDTTMFPLDWILQFPRAKEALKNLTDVSIHKEKAFETLRRMFRRYKPSPYYREGFKLCNEDINQYHQEFQFQLVRIDSEFPQKLAMFMRGAALPNGVFLDDLYGLLGAFTLNAAVGEHYFQLLRGNRARLEINDVCIYMRDVFTFHDRISTYFGVISGGSQYLGHWNKTGFVIVPKAVAMGEATQWEWPFEPFARDGMITERGIYYPIRNKDYRDWQLKHKQGGDLLLYSNMRRVKLSRPLTVEVAW
ncbi:hypothetical protein LMG23992_01766 [Cupriavidus laharis]|uniref:Uncharacterized protein n=2 Tax=Cupriavidus laharis TaxID=151654 RepID=A0ABM8WTD4_9BURK|nr:hypothetical protein LMG23992_01766 [Cupriavidus laharis]